MARDLRPRLPGLQALVSSLLYSDAARLTWRGFSRRLSNLTWRGL